MKTMNNIITKDLFINAYKICKNYAENSSLNDINILLLKNSFIKLTENKLIDFYDKYITDDKFYGNPVLFSSDIVHIPKGISGFREYRFFDIYSMILYNAIGLLFYNICNDTISKINIKNKNIYTYTPTTFKRDENTKSKYYKDDYKEIIADKNYRNDYVNYIKKLKEYITKDKCIIKIDISNYFDSIPHNKLISLIDVFSVESSLALYNYDKESNKELNFYFESMMNSKKGIPQGRDNCFSDYFGELYLKQFDFKIRELIKNDHLKFNSMIRYVDDITIVFDINKTLTISEHYKILSFLTQKISNYLLNNLDLKLNTSKTEFIYFKNDEQVNEYLCNQSKKVSTKNEIDENNTNVEIMFNDFIETLKKFQYSSDCRFKFEINFKDKEVLKYVFNKNFCNYICKEENTQIINEIISSIDLELTTDSLYILIVLFFLKSKNKKLFSNSFNNNINTNLTIFDKRSIHLAMMYFTQILKLDGIKQKIKKSLKDLQNDDYGKYLIPLSNYYHYIDSSYLDKQNIYNTISWRYCTEKNTNKILPPTNILYNSLYNKYILNNKFNIAQIQQLRDFVYYYRKEEWNLAYNSFYNFFHELCKKIFKRDSVKYDINNIIDDLKGLINEEENLELIRFADSRNFNSISHPSKNGKISIKISEDKLNNYIYKIGNIIIKLLDSFN